MSDPLQQASSGSWPFALAPHVTLMEWQARAVQGWRASKHATRGARHGILEAVTGTGKTLAAIACIADASQEVPDLRVAVVVPSQLLATQWKRELVWSLGLSEAEVGLCMTGHRASLRTHRVVVWVINSARERLAADAAGLEVLLVVDECHRSGSGRNRTIYDAPTRFRLGLSATAHRQGEVDEDGLLVPLERQVHARQLGPTVEPRITVALAEHMGLLPPFRLVHHGLSLSREEQARYRALSRDVSAAIEAAGSVGLKGGGIHAAIAAGAGARFSKAQVAAALEVQRAMLARKQFLYLRPERARAAALLVAEELAGRPPGAQAILFHERISDKVRVRAEERAETEDDEEEDGEGDNVAQRLPGEGAEELHARLHDLAEDGRLALLTPPHVALRRHHTGHPDAAAFQDMRRQMGDPLRAQVLVSVKGAVEGVDLPDADLGVVVASSSSVRQRIQTLGRILRPLRSPDGQPLPPSAYEGLPPRTLHLLYFHDTVDAEIYQQTDWEQLLGPERNAFRLWDFGAEQSSEDPAPPEPPPSDEEAAAWARAALEGSFGGPVPWLGRQPSVNVQPLVYKGNAIRATRSGPPLEGGAPLAAIADAAAKSFGLPETSFRGSLFLRVADGLVVRAAPAELGPLTPVHLPGRTSPVAVRWLVLGRFEGAVGAVRVPVS